MRKLYETLTSPLPAFMCRDDSSGLVAVSTIAEASVCLQKLPGCIYDIDFANRIERPNLQLIIMYRHSGTVERGGLEGKERFHLGLMEKTC